MQKLIDEIKKTGGDMACRGRAESNRDRKSVV